MWIARESLSTAAAFLVTLLMTRLVGKKIVTQLTVWDLVSAVTMGSLAAHMLLDRDTPLYIGITHVVMWGAFTMIVAWIALRSRWARGLLQGKPTVVVHNGKLLEESMGAERYNADILLSQLRNQGVFDLRDVEFAVLEPTGKLSVLLKSQKQPVTPSDLHVATPYEGIATELIMQGQVIEANLKAVGLDRTWLDAELRHQGIADLSEVFHAELETDGTLYVDRFDDKVGTQHDPSDHPPRGVTG